MAKSITIYVIDTYSEWINKSTNHRSEEPNFQLRNIFLHAFHFNVIISTAIYG